MTNLDIWKEKFDYYCNRVEVAQRPFNLMDPQRIELSTMFINKAKSEMDAVQAILTDEEMAKAAVYKLSKV